MLRAFALVSILSLTAGAALAQPPGDPNGYGAQPPAQQPYPPADQGGAPPDGGYGQGGYGQGGHGQGGGRWGGDPGGRALHKQLRAACATDISTYCTGIGEGDGRAMHACMMTNQARFSPPCQSAIADMRAHRHPQDGGPPAPDGQPGDAARPPGPPPQP